MPEEKPSAATPDLRTRPLQLEIAALARKIWETRGRPVGRDEAIWLEAERQLLGAGDLVNLGSGTAQTDALHQSAPPPAAGPAAGPASSPAQSARHPVSPDPASS
jgi:hypothetical protein